MYIRHSILMHVSLAGALLLLGCADGKKPIVFNSDTSWCWFQDERAIIDGGRLLLAGVSADGDVTVTSHDLESGQNVVHVLHDTLQANDHAVPALFVRPDGRYLAVYSRHNGDYMFWRITEEPGDVTRWRPERRFDHGARATYSNLYSMATEGPSGRIYNFTRTRQWDPNFVVSDDHGDSWTYGGRLIDGGGSEQRPYVRYAGNGVDEIHFITTEQHPRDFANSVYHGYISRGRSYRSDGTLVDDDIFDEEAPAPHAFTRVFPGDENNVAWTSDIELDREGHPYVAYSVTKDRIEPERGGMDHRYRYAGWDGASWHEQEIAHAGTRLYEGEDAYTGLIALHPSSPDVVFISTDADPISGEPIPADGVRRYEIFRGVTADGGETWSWTAITENSTQDNLRPIVAASRETWAVAWLRGEYRAYTDYNQAAVGLIYDELPRDFFLVEDHAMK